MSEYIKFKIAFDNCWKLLKDLNKLEKDLEKIPEKLRKRLYKHPFVEAYDLLP